MPKIGLFLNSHSPTVAEQLAHSGYDWLLVDSQHGPMGYEKLSAMLSGIASGGAKSLVRVGGYQRPRREFSSHWTWAQTACWFLTSTRPRKRGGSELHPISHGRNTLSLFSAAQYEQSGLLGYAGAANENTIVALQVETADLHQEYREIAAVPDVDILFLGQNDLCMSMGLYEKYEFPHMYTSPELAAATNKLIAAPERTK